MSADRVLRGGSCYDDASYARVADRRDGDASHRYDVLGFRLVEEPKEAKEVCRVYRGGGWYDAPAFARAADRTWSIPSNRLSDLGFRLVEETSPHLSRVLICRKR